jgi:hypothetical protein
MVRVQCLAAAVVLIAAIFVLRPPVVAIVGLAILGLYQLTLFAPNKALRIERTDGQSWTVRFCRDYDFDVSMAFEDAARLRDAVRPVSTPSPRKDEAAA